MKKLICPTCRQNMNEPPQPGLDGKDCPQCGQGLSWRRAAAQKRGAVAANEENAGQIVDRAMERANGVAEVLATDGDRWCHLLCDIQEALNAKDGRYD